MLKFSKLYGYRCFQTLKKNPYLTDKLIPTKAVTYKICLYLKLKVPRTSLIQYINLISFTDARIIWRGYGLSRLSSVWNILSPSNYTFADHRSPQSCIQAILRNSQRYFLRPKAPLLGSRSRRWFFLLHRHWHHRWRLPTSCRNGRCVKTIPVHHYFKLLIFFYSIGYLPGPD